MSESIIKIEYKNGKPEYLVVDGEKLSRFDLLALASRTDDKKFAWKIMNIASILFHWQDDHTFNSLYGSVAIQITVDNQINEFTIHQKFSERVKELLGNDAKIIKRIDDVHHRPDFWVRLNGEDIPVEIKLNKFNQKALNQLLRYMNFYETSKGIAVGSELDVQLPDNIIFISSEKLR